MDWQEVFATQTLLCVLAYEKPYTLIVRGSEKYFLCWC